MLDKAGFEIPEAFDSSVEANDEPWEKPVRFDEFTVGNFPEEWAPACLQSFAKASSIATQTPLSMNIAAVLGCAAMAVHGKYEVQIASGYTEPLNLFIAIVANPAERKSSVLKNAAAPLNSYEARRDEQLRLEVMQSRAEYDLLLMQQENIKKKAVKSSDLTELNEITAKITNFEHRLYRSFKCFECFECTSVYLKFTF